MPSKQPEASLENYGVDLDDDTGVYHIFLRRASLRASLALMKSSKPCYSSHFVEFSNGDMTAVPRVECAVTTREREIPMKETSIPESEPDCHDVADETSSLVRSLVSPSYILTSHGKTPAPADTDSSITGLGRIVGQQAVEEQSGLCTLSESLLHTVPRDIKKYTRIRAEYSDAATQTEELVTPTVAVETSELFTASRRSSLRSQESGTTPSTVPTSPTSSRFSMEPIGKLALADSLIRGVENAVDFDWTISPLLGLDLRISRRQLIHLDGIEHGESPQLEEVSPKILSVLPPPLLRGLLF